MTESTLDFQLEQAIGLNVNRAAFLMTEEIAAASETNRTPLNKPNTVPAKILKITDGIKIPETQI